MKRFAIAVLSLLMIGLSPGASLASGTIPGCDPAKHVTFKGPWDGGAWYFPRWTSNLKPLRLAIVHVWYNLNQSSIKDHPRNPGQPPWDQVLVKTKITPRILRDLGGEKVRLIGAGGEAWIYANNRACRHNIHYEFRNGNFPIKTLGKLAEEGLTYIY